MDDFYSPPDPPRTVRPPRVDAPLEPAEEFIHSKAFAGMILVAVVAMMLYMVCTWPGLR